VFGRGRAALTVGLTVDGDLQTRAKAAVQDRPQRLCHECGHWTAPRYDLLLRDEANTNLVIPNTYIGPVTKPVPHRSRMFRVTKEGWRKSNTPSLERI
jgi:hypothetical protein